MPAMLLATAAYAAYKTYERNNSFENEVDTSGKKSIELLESERTLGIFEAPVTTITWYEGSYLEASKALTPRVLEIFEKNPWLAGWILHDTIDNNRPKLFFDDSSEQRPPGLFQMYNPGEILLERSLDRPLRTALLEAGKTMVESNLNLMGKDSPLFKVSIIPDCKTPDNHFALVVSLSHMIADGFTYYEVLKMLDVRSPVKAMNPIRDQRFPGCVEEAIGKAEVDFMTKSLSLQKDLRDLVDHMRNDDRSEGRIIKVSPGFVEEERQRFSTRNDDDDDVDLTTNSLLSSWFFRTVKASVAFQACNMRNRLEGCDVTDNDAGNYAQALFCVESDYQSPQNMQTVIQRIGHGSSKEAMEMPVRPDGGFKFSLCTNWSGFLSGDIRIDETSKFLFHTPVYSKRIADKVSSKFSILILFSLSPSTSDDRPMDLGALIFAPKSVWGDIIDKCGIVEEYLN